MTLSCIEMVIKPSLSTIGVEIRRFRNEIGITQNELGKECGLLGSYISSIERRGNRPSSKTFNIMIEVMARMRQERVNHD